MTGLSTTSRLNMIKRLNDRFNATLTKRDTANSSRRDGQADNRNVRQDSGSHSYSKEARQRMIARLKGQTFKEDAPGRTVYREDSADPLAWYRQHLRNEGWSQDKIDLLLMN